MLENDIVSAAYSGADEQKHGGESSAVCPTCGATATGRYCANCGERFLQRHDFDMRHFLSEHVTHEMLEIDGKLPRTLRMLLTRPGQLAVDFVAGRRKPFVTPLRLYLVIFLLHIFLLSCLAAHPRSIQELVQESNLSDLLSRLMASRGSIDWTDAQFHEHLLTRLHWVSQALTLLVFLGVAGIQSLLLMRQRRYYLEHLSLALNVSAFYLLLCVVADIVAALFWHREMQSAAAQMDAALAVTALPLYWCFSLRRFYRIGWVAAITLAVVLTSATAVLAGVLQVGFLALIIETT